MLTRMRRARGFFTMLALLALVAPTAARSADSYGRIAAFDLATGSVHFDVAAPTAAFHLHAIAPGVVVATGSDECNVAAAESAFAFELGHGSLLWRRQLFGACFDYSAPAVTSGTTAAFEVRHGIAGWAARTGVTRWSSPHLQAPLSHASAAMTVDSNTSVVDLIAPGTGRILRSTRAPSKPFAWLLTPRIAVLVTQSIGASTLKDRLTALDTRSGATLWQRGLGQYGGFGSGLAAGSDGVVVIGTPNGKGWRSRAFDLLTGRPLWSLPSLIAATGSGLALVTASSGLRAFDIHTGALRWQVPYPDGSPVELDQVVARDGAVALVTQHSATVFEARDGAQRWTQPLDDDGVRYHPTAAIDQGLLIVPTTSSAWVPYDE
jgi:outer membrane protein assembly factor BamB